LLWIDPQSALAFRIRQRIASRGAAEKRTQSLSAALRFGVESRLLAAARRAA
jgi:hypothetical protein